MRGNAVLGEATPRRSGPAAVFLAALALAAGSTNFAAGAESALLHFRHGEYEEAIATVARASGANADSVEDTIAAVQSQLALGKYEDASRAVMEAVGKFPDNLPLHWLAHEVALANGKSGLSQQQVDEIRRRYQLHPWSYRDAASLVAFGRAALLLGADPKEVLDKIYSAAAKLAPQERLVFLARGELALSKHDFALAAKAFGEGLKILPDDPDLHAGAAQALAEGDRKAMLEEAAAALKTNPRHVPTLVLLAEQKVDEENYDEAQEILGRIVAIDPVQPEAWAMRTVLAVLHNDPAGAIAARERALTAWSNNPQVDFLIGKKLAQKYRFGPAANYERQALRFSPDFLPAKAELANDLLRLGEEAEGWELAESVHTADEYDVEAYNLATLHDTMAKYATLQNDDFVLRMSATQAPIYGQRALALLVEAKKVLAAKYGVELQKPTYVEIFADPKDFAVRTFGVPDVNGFLGVCFGRVVTANGPNVAGHGANWEAVLWHEFCHVVTLQLTENKMPRWLSEGISVYEEGQRDPSWGQHVSPTYREMLLGKDLTPLSRMSGAFLAPKTPLHLQFAYYEASLVVEFLVQRSGLEKLRAVLKQLREGNDINLALGREIAPLPQLEKEFTAFAHARANGLAPTLDWEKPPEELLRPGAESELAQWLAGHPKNYWALEESARSLVRQKKYAEARAPLKALLENIPDLHGDASALQMLAAVQRGVGDEAGEKDSLVKLSLLEDDAIDVYQRLMDLGVAESDWPLVADNAERYLAVNPMIGMPWRNAARAATARQHDGAAIDDDRIALRLDPANPAEIHFDLAQHLQRTGAPAEAHHELLLALEDAPRNRSALKMLLESPMPSEPADTKAEIGIK